MNINKKIVIATPTVLEKMVRRCALLIKSATAFAVLAVASVPPMLSTDAQHILEEYSY